MSLVQRRRRWACPAGGDVMCSEARPEPQRPKIELVRVSSSERAKIPVNPVQLSLAYRHIR